MAALVSGILLVPGACAQEPVDVPAELNAILDRAAALEPLETVVIARNGEIVAERGYRGHATDKPTNIKSASKTVLSGLIGMAIDRGELSGV